MLLPMRCCTISPRPEVRVRTQLIFLYWSWWEEFIRTWSVPLSTRKKKTNLKRTSEVLLAAVFKESQKFGSDPGSWKSIFPRSIFRLSISQSCTDGRTDSNVFHRLAWQLEENSFPNRVTTRTTPVVKYLDEIDVPSSSVTAVFGDWR